MYSIRYQKEFHLFLILFVICITYSKINKSVATNQTKQTNQTLFRATIVGIFVADSELPYTLELAKPSIEIAIQKVFHIIYLIKLALNKG